MKFLLISIGTRGDMEPFLATAELLQSRGHEVSCAFPTQFAHLAEDTGIRFHGLSKGFLEMLDSEEGQLAMGGSVSFIRKIQLYYRLYKKSNAVNAVLLEQQAAIVADDRPDRIIYGGKAIYPILWGLKHPGRAIALSPVPCLIHPVHDIPHIGFKGNYGTLLNKMTYSLANFGLVRHILSVGKKLPNQSEVTGHQIKSAILAQKMLYTFSPTLFPRKPYWPEQVSVVGYRERRKTRHWKPDQTLTDFLAQHSKILFITFGSMTNPAPETKTAVLLDILQRHGIPAIINTAAGGLEQPVNLMAENVHFVDDIPYDWIFPQVHAVIHHGGSGTTHSALRCGCATMIIPHIIDQFLWNTLLYDQGVGPKGFAIGKFSREALEPLLLDLYRNASYRQRAEAIADDMGQEQLDDVFEHLLTH